MSSRAFPERRAFRAMGVEVVLGGAGEHEATRIARLFEGWERVFSRFRPESELNRVNRDPAPVVVVSKLFASVLRDALGAAAATRGLVDPTLGLALEAAGYDRDFALLADDDSPLGPTARGRWGAVRLSGRLLSRPPGTVLDLNGVAKALAVDAALDEIDGDGFVAAGGDVAARGGAVVGLPAGESLRVQSGGVATSGTTRRRWRRGGALQHHLIDPRTGRPARSRWDEVTVAAASCLAADVAAKAAFLLSEDGPGWLDERGLPGRFVVGDEAVPNEAWRALAAGAEVAA
jgi:thiamine biosynthesis lipoprotein